MCAGLSLHSRPRYHRDSQSVFSAYPQGVGVVGELVGNRWPMQWGLYPLTITSGCYILSSMDKHDAAVALGAMGGEATARLHGKAHFSTAGKKGMTKRWGNKRLLHNSHTPGEADNKRLLNKDHAPGDPRTTDPRQCRIDPITRYCSTHGCRHD